MISRHTINRSIDDPHSETDRIAHDGRNVGGVILKIDKETNYHELDTVTASKEFRKTA